MSIDTAKEIASRMMGGWPIETFDEIVKSAIGEMANMIMGNTSTLFSEKKIKVDITPPSILVGRDMTMSTSNMVTICVPLMLDNGYKIDMDVAISE